jgi:DNA excision repair protein ERCC-4
VIVANAHRVSDESGEGFAIRLYRQGNSSGWLRAFSDVPTSFAGVSKVSR